MESEVITELVSLRRCDKTSVQVYRYNPGGVGAMIRRSGVQLQADMIHIFGHEERIAGAKYVFCISC